MKPTPRSQAILESTLFKLRIMAPPLARPTRIMFIYIYKEFFVEAGNLTTLIIERMLQARKLAVRAANGG